MKVTLLHSVIQYPVLFNPSMLTESAPDKANITADTANPQDRTTLRAGLIAVQVKTKIEDTRNIVITAIAVPTSVRILFRLRLRNHKLLRCICQGTIFDTIHDQTHRNLVRN
jgi:hypothetical protein